jgi:hypothetical protein
MSGQTILRLPSGGNLTVAAADSASNNVATFPANTGTVVTTGSTRVVSQTMIATNVAGKGPAFSAYGSALQSIASSSLVKVAYNTILFDTNSNYDTTNYRFLPTIAGYYLITANFISSTAGSNYPLLISLYKNGSRFADGSYSIGWASNGGQVNMSYILYLNGSTDYVEIYGYQASGSTLSMGSNGNGQNFSAAMVRSA